MTEPYIGTYTGKHFHFLNPTEDEICIEDIAQALSMNCRFSGHVSKFYSVAEHCCIIADLVEQADKDKREVLSALLHDASEAYICDIPRPIKPHLNNYFEMELKIEKVIQSKYDITAKTELIDYYDYHICGEEARQLFLHTPDWVKEFDRLENVKIHAWSPQIAKEEFLKRFNRLTGYVPTETPEETEWFESMVKNA